MLTALSIKNYALIDQLQVRFTEGFTVITGETGTGKSILLGGLALILGKRADLSSLKNKDEKCVIEASFNISNYALEPFFVTEDLDYAAQTIIRREILPSGKSRAFVNDTPVNLKNLQALGEKLIDIHSQQETLQLVDDHFQFQVMDALAENQNNLENYQNLLKKYKHLNKQKEKLYAKQAEAIKQQDYHEFLLNELQKANIVDGEEVQLEAEYEALNNIEFIEEKLSHSQQLLQNEDLGIIGLLSQVKNNLQQLSKYANNYQDLFHRVQSSFIELDDTLSEIERLQENLESNPNRLTEVNSKLQTLHNLMQKHTAANTAELIQIKTELEAEVAVTQNLDNSIQKVEAEILQVTKELDAVSKIIHNNRIAIVPKLTQQLENLLSDLGMPNAKFSIALQTSNNYLYNGKSNLEFLFTANKGGEFKALKKAASGGEMARIMLAIKSILANYIQLPTIMFDEIDTGVSGEIANKMAHIMQVMSNNMQVFAITHLPQIAAKGHSHFKVYKEDINELTTTNMVQLKPSQRIEEIAQMLGGVKASNAAIAHAKQLLN